MGAPVSKTLTNVAVPPGGVVDISVPLTAPTIEGTYKGNYHLQAPDGTTFGIGSSASSVFWVQIYSQAPTATPAAFSVIPMVTLVVLKPDLKITNISFSPSVVKNNIVMTVKVSVYNAGLVTSHNSFTVKWWGLSTFANPSCNWTINDNLPAHGGVVKTCTFTFASSYAAAKTKAIVDTDNTVVESNEGNNTYLEDILVQ
jgi:hypothetical protein